MNRLDEIKSKLANWRKEWEASRGCADMEDFSEDVQHLLTKLEIADKALNRLAVAAPGEREELARHREQVAIEALKAIRE